MGLGNAHLHQILGVKFRGSTTTLPLGFTVHNGKFDNIGIDMVLYCYTY